jgi:RND superfamily putative drug exporter
VTGPLYRLGRLAARRWKLVIPIWLVVVVVTVLVANSVGRPTNSNLELPGTGSTEATDLLAEGLPKQANGSVPIVLRATDGTLTAGANEQAVKQTVKELRSDRYVNEVISPLSQQGSSSITEDGKLAFISVFLSLSSGDLTTEEAEQVFSKTEPAQRAGIDVSAGGYLGQQLSVPDTSSSDRLGVIVAILILLMVFGSAVAMAMPITTAIAALLTGLALIGFLGHAIDVPQVAPTLATMLGLAVGIDYSLFIISRHQRQIREGMDPSESVARAIATAGGAVVFAGSTVVVALLCLYFGGVELVRSLGYTAALVVIVAVLAALTLLPALLGAFGRRIESLSIPFAGGPPPAGDTDNPWARWAALVGRHPLRSALAGVALLVVLAIPIFQMQLGSIDFGQYPKDTTERQAYDKLSSGFGVGYNAPLLIAVKFPADDPAKPDNQAAAQAEQQLGALQQQEQEEIAAGEEQAPSAEEQQQQEQLEQQEQIASTPAGDRRLMRLQRDVSDTKGVKEVTPAQVNDSGTTGVFSAIPATGPAAEQTRDLVDELRDEVIPKADQNDDLEAYVGGQTAAFIDLASEISDRLVLVIAIVVVLGFLLIAAAFRSLVIPALAALLNLLAVAAAYGVLTAVFELGWGVRLIGLEESLPVVSFVPLLMFAILFGLSMDYQVFLLSRSKEGWDSNADHHRAVIGGLGLASRVIIAAATIMFSVFASFILNGDPTVKQFGVGLAVAVAIDGLVVTTIMPALMLLVGRRAWWMPAGLDRLIPDIGIEGEDYFRDREAASAAAARGTAGGG